MSMSALISRLSKKLTPPFRFEPMPRSFSATSMPSADELFLKMIAIFSLLNGENEMISAIF